MENNKTIIVGLLALIIGLLGGYSFGANTPTDAARMADEMEEHMYEDEMVRNDGAMQHAMDDMMLGLRGLEGEAYEEMFLRGMIVHHIGAIGMAEELLEQTDRPELVELANNIIASQSAEVEQMKRWLQTWFSEE